MSQLPERPEPSSSSDVTLSGGALKAIVGVAALALVVILYLVVDFVRARQATQRFERRRQLAREAWRKETAP